MESICKSPDVISQFAHPDELPIRKGSPSFEQEKLRKQIPELRDRLYRYRVAVNAMEAALPRITDEYKKNEQLRAIDRLNKEMQAIQVKLKEAKAFSKSSQNAKHAKKHKFDRHKVASYGPFSIWEVQERGLGRYWEVHDARRPSNISIEEFESKHEAEDWIAENGGKSAFDRLNEIRARYTALKKMPKSELFALWQRKMQRGRVEVGGNMSEMDKDSMASDIINAEYNRREVEAAFAASRTSAKERFAIPLHLKGEDYRQLMKTTRQQLVQTWLNTMRSRGDTHLTVDNAPPYTTQGKMQMIEDIIMGSQSSSNSQFSLTGAKARFEKSKASFNAQWDAEYEREANQYIRDAEELIKKCEQKRHEIYDMEVRTLPRWIDIMKQAIRNQNKGDFLKARQVLANADNIRRSFARSTSSKSAFNQSLGWTNYKDQELSQRLQEVHDFKESCYDKVRQIQGAIQDIPGIESKLAVAKVKKDTNALSDATIELSNLQRVRSSFSRVGEAEAFAIGADSRESNPQNDERLMELATKVGKEHTVNLFARWAEGKTTNSRESGKSEFAWNAETSRWNDALNSALSDLRNGNTEKAVEVIRSLQHWLFYVGDKIIR